MWQLIEDLVICCRLKHVVWGAFIARPLRLRLLLNANIVITPSHYIFSFSNIVIAPSHNIFWHRKWKRQASPPLHCWNWTATPWCPLVVLAWRSEAAASSSRNHFFSQWLSFNCESRWVYLHVLRRPRRGLCNMPKSNFVNYVIPGPLVIMTTFPVFMLRSCLESSH